MVALTDLLNDVKRAHEVPVDDIPALMTQCAAVQAALAARLLEARAQDEKFASEVIQDGDGWLTTEEAAELSRLGVRWLYRHWRAIPGAKKFSPRQLRFRESAFRKWLQKGP